MAYTGSEFVTLDEAANWTSKYRATINEGEIISPYFGREKIEAILNQEDCVGINTYHGIDDGKKNLILVGTSTDEQDMENGILVEKALPCPPTCRRQNRLNG